MLWWAMGKNMLSTKSIFLYGQYPAVAIFRDKIHVHRLLISYKSNCKLLPSLHVHHKNSNRLDARLENLEILTASAHLSLTNKGRKFSSCHKAKIAEANKRRLGKKMKKRVSIDLTELSIQASMGWSISRSARYFNCGWSTIKSRLYENEDLLK